MSAIARRIVSESAAAVAGASCTESLYKSEARAGVLAIMRRFADEPVAVEAGASEDKRDCSGGGASAQQESTAQVLRASVPEPDAAIAAQ